MTRRSESTWLTGAEAPRDAIGQRILDAALRLFSTQGIDRTTMEEVAKRAGVTRVTVYRRFSKKGDLALAVIQSETMQSLAKIDGVMRRQPSIERKLVEGFVTALRTAQQHPLLRYLLDTEPETVLPYVTLHGAPMHAVGRSIVAGYLRAAQESGELAAFDADVVAEMFVRLVQSFVLTPDGYIDLDTDKKARAFAKRYLVAPLRMAGP